MIASLSLCALGFAADDPLTVARVAQASGFGGAHLRLDLADRLGRDALLDLVTVGSIAPTWTYPLDGLFADDAEQSRAWDRAFRATAPFARDLGVSAVCSRLPPAVSSPPAGVSGIRAAGLVRRLQGAAATARAAGLTLGLTYESQGQVPGSLAAMTDLLDVLDLGLVADSIHLAAAGALARETPTAWAGRVVDVHLADPVPASSGSSSRPTPLGRRWPQSGATENARLLQLLAATGYRGPVMLDAPAAPGISPGVAAARAGALLAGLLSSHTRRGQVPTAGEMTA